MLCSVPRVGEAIEVLIDYVKGSPMASPTLDTLLRTRICPLSSPQTNLSINQSASFCVRAKRADAPHPCSAVGCLIGRFAMISLWENSGSRGGDGCGWLMLPEMPIQKNRHRCRINKHQLLTQLAFKVGITRSTRYSFDFIFISLNIVFITCDVFQ